MTLLKSLNNIKSVERLNVLKNNSQEVFLSDATLFIEYFGIINIAWQWLRQGIAAQKKLNDQSYTIEHQFYSSKMQTMKYFFHYEFPKTKSLAHRLMENELMTLWSEIEALI